MCTTVGDSRRGVRTQAACGAVPKSLLSAAGAERMRGTAWVRTGKVRR